jgi:averantin hydroxylase
MESLAPFLGRILSLGLVLVILQVSGKLLYNVFLHPLRRYPGPKLWAATEIPRVLEQAKGTEVYSIRHLHEKYGPVVRIAPDEISYANSVPSQEILAHRPNRREFPKPELSRITPPNGVNGIIFADRESHSRLRRAFAASFSERAMRLQQPAIRKHIDLLIQGLHQRCSEAPQDVTMWFNWTTFDIIGALVFGQSFGCLENQRMHPWIAHIFGNVKAISLMRAIKQLGLGLLLPYITPTKAIENRLTNFKFAEDRMRARLEMGSNQGDFLDPILEKGAKEDGGLSFEELVSTGNQMVLAGSETMATLLSGVVFYLLKYPKHMKRTVNEVRSAFSSADEIDLFSTVKLKYMLAVLDETMRLYPPVPAQVGREVPAGGESIGGQYLPGGTKLYLAQYVMNGLEQNWTERLEFYPERFLDERPAKFEKDNYEVLQPFSVGTRNCIGRNLAYAEMRLMLARVLYDFDLKPDPRSEDWSSGQRAYVLWDKPPLWVTLTPRMKE